MAKSRKRGTATPTPATASAAPGSSPAARQATGGAIRVEATQIGYYDHTRRRVGDVFTIKAEQEFSRKWMRRVDASVRERTTTPNQAIAQQHDEILALKSTGQQPGIQVGRDDVPDDVPTGEANPLGD